MELDELEGNNEWKRLPDSLDYDTKLVEIRLRQLDEARMSCDVGKMLFLIRTALTRDLGDMGNLRMYKHSHIGTKDLIERYITSALETLNALLEVSAKAKCDCMESKYILEQMLSTRQAFGRSALLLSGGATFGLNHIGVLKALWEAKLLPRIISGASAGSIVCAVLCTRVDEEIPKLLETLCKGDLAVFEEEGKEDGLLRKVARFLKHGALFDIRHLTRVMKDLLGEMTFQEAYNRTRKILNISVSSASLFELPRLLNYITAPNILIWSAVAASCSVPCIYTAAALLAKDPKTGDAVPWNPSPQRWIDGSVDNDIPVTRLAEMFNVNHFIVSQVNPHVVPFLIGDEDAVGEEVKRSGSSITPGPTWFNSFSHLAKSEALHRMHTLADFGVLPNLLTKTVSVLSQKYSGDITIFPEINYADFPRMLSNPTPESMQQAMISGERATWSKISIIKNHCAIELALDDAVQKLRARVVFSQNVNELRIDIRRTIESKTANSGKHTKIKRTLSQNSTSSAPLPMNMNTSIHTRTQKPSGRLAPSIRHEKSQSLNTKLINRGPISAFPVIAMDEGLAPTTVPDLNSSGVDETPNLTSSSTSSPFSSPTDSPSSPAESAPIWNHSLFKSNSQPTTPSVRQSGYFSPRQTSSTTRTVPSDMAMTSRKSVSDIVSSPIDYSDCIPRSSHGHAPQNRGAEMPAPWANRSKWILDIDIPKATRKLVTRSKKKRTSET